MNIEDQIVKLYLENKFSVQQVADFLNSTSSKVRYVLDKRNIKRRNRSDAIRYLNITKFKKEEFEIKNNINNDQEKLKIAGAMIYWGEGTKSGNSVVLSNTNPKMIKLFLKFLREICGISEKRLRVVLHRYPDQNKDVLKKYWMNITKIPSSQFSKSSLHNKPTGSYKRISPFGTVSLRYSDKKLLNIINSWIDEYGAKL